MSADERLLLGASSSRMRRTSPDHRYAALLRTYHFHTLLAFACGFLMALLMLLFYDRQLRLCDQLELPFSTVLSGYASGSSDYYQMGRMGGALPPEPSLEREVRVLCMVLTCPKYYESRAAHVRATWGRRCTKLLFASSVEDAELGAVQVVEATADTYHNLWNKTREGFRYVYERHADEYDWFLKADDDTYVIMENLRYMLYSYDPETPIYFGYQMLRYEVNYMSGGASYVLSKAALRRFMTFAYANRTICPHAHPYGAEDFNMGICLQNIGVYLGDSRAATDATRMDGKSKYFPLDLAAYMEPQWNATIPEWVFDMTPFSIDVGLNCSKFPIALHYADPARLYLYEYLIYHVRIFGQHRAAWLLPAKKSAQDVERLFGRNSSDGLIDLEPLNLPDNF